jgi:HK97 family phage prohead protease
MGIMRRAAEFVRLAVFGADETPPRPIAQVLLDMAGRGLLPRAGRPEALSVPAVLRARNLICSPATLPLIQRNAQLEVVALPLLQQIDPDVANVVTLAQTLEDLLFEGLSWWRILRFGSDGYPTYAQHIDFYNVSLQPPGAPSASPLPGGHDPRDAVVYMYGEPVPASDVIRFDSPNPGLLQAGGRAVRRALLLDTTSALYADNPRPLDYFTPTEGADPITDEAVGALLAEWEANRKRRSTAYVPAALTYNQVDAPTPVDLQLDAQLRQATLSIANAAGLDPEDLGVSTTSRTYQNGVDRRQDRINDTFSPYMAAITQRLSMPDVTKRGYQVAFDLDEYLRADPLTRATVYEKAGVGQWMTDEEVRAEEGRAPFTAAQRAQLAPAPAPSSNVIPINRPRSTALAADAQDAVTFAVDVTPLISAVDVERRIVEGVVLPYGLDKVAWKSGKRWRFQQGSLVVPAELHRNKALRDHDQSQPLGKLTFAEDRPDGMFARYKIAEGPDGDRALAEAADGIRDGFSVGAEINDATPDPHNQGVLLVSVGGAAWRETSLLAIPAFDDARVTRVAAGADQGDRMETCATCGASLTQGVTHTCPAPTPTATPPAPALQLTAEQQQQLFRDENVLRALMGVPQPAAGAQPEQAQFGLSTEQLTTLAAGGHLQRLLGIGQQPQPEQRPIVDPTRRPVGGARTEEPPNYVMDRNGNLGKGKFDFSSDVIEGLRDHNPEAIERAEGFIQAQFASELSTFDTSMANVAALNPSRQRPDLYVDQKEYRYPIWNAINKGTLQDITPFVLPKFSSSSGLVAAHTEGVEPTLGSVAATNQTITPSALSGKVSITREAWDQGGNPQLSGIIWRQMTRAWFEALEAASVTMLEALSLPGALTITLPTAAQDDTLVSAMESAIAALQFVRGGFRFEDAFGQVDLYQALIGATDADGRKLLPLITPVNAAGQAMTRYARISVGGVEVAPSWALAATGTVSANSYLFDRGDVSGWATEPRRLTMEEIEVRYVHIGIWGYKAFACTDTTGVRRFAYDPQ